MAVQLPERWESHVSRPSLSETQEGATKKVQCAFEDTLLKGSSSPCLTYGSPSLSRYHKDGSLFEIINMELWTLTPCMTLEEAEKLELGRLFFEKHSRQV